MANQFIDFTKPGATGDSGERDPAAIRPVTNTEEANQDVFQRPSENLRNRTEVIRKAIDELKYLSDADRSMLLSGGGNIHFRLTSGLGDFTINSPLVLRPFLSVPVSTVARAVLGTGAYRIDLRTIASTTGGVPPPRAYSGANQISVAIEADPGAGSGDVTVTVSGVPADNIHIVIGDEVTCDDIVTAINSYPPVVSLGVVAALAPGVIGSSIFNPISATGVPQYFTGALDAEEHEITPAGLLSFFSDPENLFRDGDVLAIHYETMVAYEDLGDVTHSGRRQSIRAAPEHSQNVDGNLFLLRRHPERVPYALPVCARMGNQLIFTNGFALGAGSTAGFGSAYLPLTGGTVSGAVAFQALVSAVNANFAGDISANNATIAGTATVSGTVVAANVTVQAGGALNVLGASSLKETSTTTLSASSHATLNELEVIQNATVGGNLAVSGRVTAGRGDFSSLESASNASVGGILTTTGGIRSMGLVSTYATSFEDGQQWEWDPMNGVYLMTLNHPGCSILLPSPSTSSVIGKIFGVSIQFGRFHHASPTLPLRILTPWQGGTFEIAQLLNRGDSLYLISDGSAWTFLGGTVGPSIGSYFINLSVAPALDFSSLHMSLGDGLENQLGIFPRTLVLTTDTPKTLRLPTALGTRLPALTVRGDGGLSVVLQDASGDHVYTVGGNDVVHLVGLGSTWVRETFS